MVTTLFLISTLFVQDTIPYKESDEFAINFDLTFKQKDHAINVFRFSETNHEKTTSSSSTPLPFISLNIKILKLKAEEIKLKVIKDDKESILRKRAEEGMEFKLTVGFSDDVKDRISGYKYVLQFLSAEKQIISQIIIEFDTEGYYFVNGQKQGKV